MAKSKFSRHGNGLECVGFCLDELNVQCIFEVTNFGFSNNLFSISKVVAGKRSYSCQKKV